MLEHLVLYWVTQYAYVGIFSLLMLGIVGLPVPDEFLLTFVGYLVFRHRLELTPALLSAFLGSACGITLSFLLGRTVGLYLVHRFGPVLHIRDAHIRRVHDWFERIGGWSLTFGYYFPGIRHLTAYVAGTAGYEPPRFALFAYSGAALWSMSFIALGYYVGDRWHAATHRVHTWTKLTFAVVCVAILVYALGRLVRRRRVSRA